VWVAQLAVSRAAVKPAPPTMSFNTGFGPFAWWNIAQHIAIHHRRDACLSSSILATAYRMRGLRVMQVTSPGRLVWMFCLDGFVTRALFELSPGRPLSCASAHSAESVGFGGPAAA